jgi:hypothetical protein
MYDQDIGRKAVTVKVVENATEWQMCVAVRAAAFIGRVGDSFEIEFLDGMDFASTHLLALSDGQPVGSMRLRYHGSAAIFERFAVVGAGPQAVAVLSGLTRAAFRLADAKRYAFAVGFAAPRLLPWWRRQGGQPITDIPLSIGNEKYYPIAKKLTAYTDGATLPAISELMKPDRDWLSGA